MYRKAVNYGTRQRTKNQAPCPLDILCRLTDEKHALNTDELIEGLGKQGIKASPRVLTRDIELLNSHDK